MGLIREPKHVDLSTKSEPWTEHELADFRALMQKIKGKNAKSREHKVKARNKEKQPA